ncbi:MAG TPA: ABC transporter permease [Parafilimonas sp.]|nr:ABC transporter permease [Parafilimonas sp.]
MFKNYFKIALRNLWRDKTYTVINILGLAVGIAAMVWAFQDYRFSFSWDNFQPDRDNVYRALTFKDGADRVKGIFPMPLVAAAKNDVPGIENAVRYDSRGMNLKAKQTEPFTEQVYFTDPGFFQLFNFPLVKGSNNIADLDAVLITESIAKKYFGKEDAVGKTLLFYAGESYARPLTVKGVLKDIPMNSSMRFGILTNFDNQLKPDGSKILPDDWTWFLDAAFFKIPNHADAITVAEKLKQYLPLQNKAREDWKASGFEMMSLREQATKSDFIDNNGLYDRPEDSATYGPFVLAFLIFLSACLNFSNTTVARSNKRLKEIGVRKVMGSSFSQLVFQMILECSAIVVVAIFLSMLFNKWWLPFFNSMFNGVHVEANYLDDPSLLLFVGIMLISTSLLAGAYPAFYVSRFNASSIFRGNIKFGGSNLFSRLMLGLQLSIAIITVIAAIAFAKNSEFQKTYDYGYNLENIMGVSFTDPQKFAAFKNEIERIPEVTGVAGTRHHIAFGFRNAVAEAEGVKKETNYFETGSGYLQVMNLRTVAGRPFDPQMESDYKDALMITENMAAMYGWTDKQALGKQIHIDSINYTVIGVLKDFLSTGLFDPVKPVAMKLSKEDRCQYLIVQARPENLTTVYNKTKAAWAKLFPLMPFNGFYQNEVTAEGYRTSKSIAQIFFWFGIVSVLLTATGLFALVSLTVLKKMREIALRKVVGATPRHILMLVNKGYFWIFLIAGGLGCYGGWALTKLLLDMIFKVNVGVSTSTLTGSVVALFAITGITTGIKVWQVIKTSPVKLLRTE